MKKYYVVLRDTRRDGQGLNPTAKKIILEAPSEKKLKDLIIDNAYKLFNEEELEYVGYAYMLA